MEKIYTDFRRTYLVIWMLVFLAPAFKAQVIMQTYNYTGAMAGFTVPVLCVPQLTITAKGGSGGNAGGLPAYMSGVFTVTPGQVLQILVGGQGGTSSSTSAGGGGGSFVALVNGVGTPTPMLVAGGGGGRAQISPIFSPGIDANITNNGNDGYSQMNGLAANNWTLFFGLGGTNGNGATNGPPAAGTPHAGNGAGFLTNGALDQCVSAANLLAQAFVNGGASGGGCIAGFGGFGGGASGGNSGGGGGGGYSGGGGSYHNPTNGGGGGSYNGGTGQFNYTGAAAGNGSITISYQLGTPISAQITPSVICAGGTATLSAGSMQSYTWTPGGSNSTSITVSPLVNTTYTVQGTNALGCVSTTLLTVPVNTALPSLTITNSGSAGVCAGKTATLTASGATSYTWSGGINPTNGISFVPASTATYVVTGGNACGTTTAATSISVNPLPNIGGSANNPTVCNGSSVTLNATGSVNGYTWYPLGTPSNVAFVPPIGTNVYTVVGVSVDNCTNTAAVTVTVFQTPTISPVSTPTAICAGKTATVSAIGALNGYTWTTVPAVFTNTMVVSPTTTSVYTVLRATGNCTSTANVTVVVNALPNLLVGPPTPSVICAGTCATVTAIGAIGYTWYPGGFPSGITMVCPNASTEYTVIASNANCTTSATSSLTVLPNPTITIAASAPTVCAGGAITMTASGGSTYTWTSPISAGQQNQATVSDSPFAITQYFVSGTSAQGCTSQANLLMLVGATPSVVASVLNPGGYICAGGIGTLQAVGVAPVNYNWVPIGSSAATTTVNPVTTTPYTVVATNTVNFCQSVGTVTLAVYISTFVVSSPTAICKGSTATISAVGAANSYTWNVPLPNTNDSIFVSPPSTTVYNVTGFTGSCTTTKTVSLLVNPIPNVTAQASKLTICRFEPGILTGGGATNYLWSSATATASTIGYTVFPTITSNYTLTGTDLNGCAKTVTVTQYVNTCLGIEEQNGASSLLSIYPNPNNGEFTIQTETAMNISIVNELGQTVRVFLLSEKENTVNVKNLPNGIYFILGEKDKTITTKKIVVNK